MSDSDRQEAYMCCQRLSNMSRIDISIQASDTQGTWPYLKAGFADDRRPLMHNALILSCIHDAFIAYHPLQSQKFSMNASCNALAKIVNFAVQLSRSDGKEGRGDIHNIWRKGGVLST